jgi:serine/threonine-protein kinase
MDIWTLSLEGKREARPWLATPSREFAPFPSPDGRWVVFCSFESGRNEIYVRPYPGPGGQTKISNDGGIEPAWSRDGKEIFYRSADSFMAVPVRTSPDFSAGQARPLFPDRYAKWGREDGPRSYDVSADGSRFLVIKVNAVKAAPVTQLNLLSDWTSAVEGSGGAAKR